MLEKMRRYKQELPKTEVERILCSASSGVLSVIDVDGYPYAVPLSYVYVGGRIYFHSANTGHKISAINNCPRASFCVIEKDDVKPERYTTHYKSVIAFGNATTVVDDEEKMFAMRQLGNKYNPHHDDDLEREIERSKDYFSIIKFEIEHMTGKQARELIG